ncbi:MAG: winged helix-turn-helix domain-containing protein [Myxococcales bacterium]|nr:winged helix-turn-helix domain-containing protein [Myxococcales bacterium]
MTAPVDHEEMNFIGLQARIVPLVAELLATLATRNPLRMYFADIAGKTLLDIVQVLRHDGISQEAIAASLGLTLNGFQARMKRLKEQHDEPPEEDGDDRRTLMERVFAFIADHPDAEQGVPIRQVGDAFRGVKRDTLNGVLHFLVQSGFLTAEGRGGRRRLRVERRPHAQGPNEHDVGVLLYREGPLTLAELARRLECSTERAASLLDRLRRDGALVEGESDGEATFAATNYHIPLDHTEGYEAAIFDHFSAMVQAICKKLRLGHHHASLADQIGGATFSLRVPVDDPLYDEVSAFLRDNRVRLESWLARANALREADLVGREVRRFTLYVGQSVDED